MKHTKWSIKTRLANLITATNLGRISDAHGNPNMGLICCKQTTSCFSFS